jgi:hypothetical protein
MSLDQKFEYIPLGRNPLAEQVMKKGCDLLDRVGIKWWLSAGTVLGIRRDDALIYHDTDIDCGALDATDSFPALDELFREEGFRHLRSTSHQRAYMYLGTIFDVYTFNRHGDEVTAMVDDIEQVKPYRLFETLGTIEFRGRTYPTPNPLDEYLEVRYGPDWRTPKTSKSNWREDTFCVR